MKMKLFLHVWKNSIDSAYAYPKPIYSFDDKDKEDSEYWVSLGETEVSFDMPPMPSDEELTNRQIDYLRKGRIEVVKEFSVKLENIDTQISELLALPCLEIER